MARRTNDPPMGMVRAPETYDALKELIVVRFEGLSGQLQRIARDILDRPERMALETITIAAARIGVQPSSLVRFAQAMGYDGFTTLQKVFRSRLIAETPDYRARIHSLRQTRGVDELSDVLNTFVDQGVSSLQHLREVTPRESLHRAVDLMHGAEEVYVLGLRRSFPIAFYLAYALGRMDRRCRLVDGTGGILRQQAALATPRDVFVVSSFAPYAPEVIDVLTDLERRFVPVVAFTDSALSPVALKARVTFEIREAEDRSFRSLVAPMCLAQSLVVGLGIKMEANSKQKMEEDPK